MTSHHVRDCMSDLANLRREYAQAELTREHVSDDPVEQFREWFSAAQDADVDDPNAMTLATAAPDGTPSARIVLLKGVDNRGFRFFTNYESRKGTELGQNPHAALVFYWSPLERQVRVEGAVERVPEEESTAYFERRPRGSQLGAWASPQSRVVESRDRLEAELDHAKETYSDAESVPRPPNWGGYILRPIQIEFWQGRPNRLHDRIRYRRSDVDDGEERWTIDRLAP